jgi:hypothetical protein
MYTFLFLLSATTIYYIYNQIKNLFTIKKSKFDDLDIKLQTLDNIEFVYEDSTRKIIKNVDNFKIIAEENNPLKYVCVSYISDDMHRILFNKKDIPVLYSLSFPFYNEIIKLPLYREIRSAYIEVREVYYDITKTIKEFAGPKLNYHKNLVNIRFEEIVEYMDIYPELKDASGFVRIEDNFGKKYIFNYPGKLIWDENILK